jgi:hypothetical protein
LDNTFIPTANISAQMNSESRNHMLSGFRWVHTTTDTDTTGSYKLQSFTSINQNEIDFMLFGNDGTINIVAPVTISNLNISGDLDMNSHRIINGVDPVYPQDFVTKAYADSIAGGGGGTGVVTLTGDVTGSGPLGSSIATMFKENPVFLGNEFMKIPVGNTNQRPLTPSEGMIRYNTDI